MDFKSAGLGLYDEVGDLRLPREIDSLLLGKEQPLYSACSGGADSVFACLWLYGYLDRGGKGGQFEIAHFNHKLRGDDSDRDQLYVEELANSLGIACQTGCWRECKPQKVTEENARDARLKFFKRLAEDHEEASVFVTGHHGDDVAETMLMRLSRGSGSEGLSAPRPVSIHPGKTIFIRPLLSLSRNRIESILSELGVEWREDATNKEGAFYRNRLRKAVMPEWRRSADRDINPGILRSRRLLEEDAVALALWLDELWPTLTMGSDELDLSTLAALPRSLQRRALWKLATEQRISHAFSAPHVEELLDAIDARKNLSLSIDDAMFARVSIEKNRLGFYESSPPKAPWPSFRLPLNSCAFLPSSGRVDANVVPLDAELKNKVMAGSLPHDRSVWLKIPSKQIKGLIVRAWKEGDAYVPFGLTAEKKLNRLFMDRKLPFSLRRRLPIFTFLDGKILWAPHLPPNKAYLIDSDTTHALQLTFET